MKKLDRGTKFLKNISKMNKNSVYWELNTTESGLDAKSISANTAQYGANIITKSDKKSKLDILIESFSNPFVAILVFIAGVSAFTDIISPILNNNKQDVNNSQGVMIYQNKRVFDLAMNILNQKNEEQKDEKNE